MPRKKLWVRAPIWVLRSETLTPWERVGFLDLQARCNPVRDDAFECWPSDETLSADWGCKPRTVRKIIKGLADKGLLTTSLTRSRHGHIMRWITLTPALPVLDDELTRAGVTREAAASA